MDSYHKQLIKELPSLGKWFHNIDLGDGIRTGTEEFGYDPQKRWNKFEKFIPADLTGKTVLDLGGSSGFYGLKMKQRGAKRVVCVDNSKKSIEQAKFLAKWFNIELEIIHQDAQIYVLTTDERFDYVIFVGTFYHLKYPVLVLDRVAEMVKEKLVFQTTTSGEPTSEFIPKERYSRQDSDELNSYDFPKLSFIETKFKNALNTWWIANFTCVVSLLRNANLKIVNRVTREIFICEPDSSKGDKAFGKRIFPKMVFPQHGKDGLVLP